MLIKENENEAKGTDIAKGNVPNVSRRNNR
jgi:hypothetical protein